MIEELTQKLAQIGAETEYGTYDFDMLRQVGCHEPIQWLVSDDGQSELPEMITVCPGVSNPRELTTKFEQEIRDNRDHPFAHFKVLWTRPGQDDGPEWYIVGQDRDVCFFMAAGCCYTGFSACGYTKFYLASDLQTLCKMGMTDAQRATAAADLNLLVTVTEQSVSSVQI